MAIQHAIETQFMSFVGRILRQLNSAFMTFIYDCVECCWLIAAAQPSKLVKLRRHRSIGLSLDVQFQPLVWLSFSLALYYANIVNCNILQCVC